jgi:hypothetical protein
MTDDAYDYLCGRLLQELPTIDHPHAHLIQLDGLQAGTGFYIPEDAYPLMVQLGVQPYLHAISTGKLFVELEPHLLPL